MLLAYMFILHFIADFLLQSREMGKKKSSEPRWLFKHLAIQWAMFAVCLAPFIGPVLSIGIATLNALVHGIIDWNIWRGYKLFVFFRLADVVRKEGAREDQVKDQVMIKAKDWQYWEDHWFYTTIGFDQLLHGLTLVALFFLLLT